MSSSSTTTGLVITPKVAPPPARNLSQHIARRILHLWGWKLFSNLPPKQPLVLTAAPHTSNWDFVFAMLVLWGLGLNANWLGKRSLFRPPFGWIMRIWGGIPVDRSKNNSLVDQVAAKFKQRPHMRLLITPEGTRSRREYWHTGFYRIAQAAKIPIALGYIDGKLKEVGFAGMLYPSGDIEKDFVLLREFYQGWGGLHPEKAGEVRLDMSRVSS